MTKTKLTKKQFLQEVREEIENLKNNATSEEIKRLDLNMLNPQSSSLCIYGQMTGHCDSERAKSLWPKKYGDVSHSNYNDIKNQGTETFTEVVKESRVFFGSALFTPLEVYITLKDARHSNVIKYLKGEISELKL